MRESEFERALNRAFNDIRGRRGSCPPAEKLAELSSGQLSSNEAASIRAHIAGCGACDAMLIQLRKFDAANADSDTRDGPVPVMERLVSTGKGKIFAALGYVVAAVLAFVFGFAGPSLWRNNPPPVQSWDTADSIDLNKARGGAASPSKSSSRSVVLSFFVDIQPDLRYEAVLDGGEAKSITSYDGVGNFHLVVNRQLLGSGRHVLTVREGKSRVIEFPFEMR